MELISLSCNNCGAPLEVPEGTKFLTCSFCKSRLAIHVQGSAYFTEVMGQLLDKVDTLINLQTDPGQWETCEIIWRRKAVSWSKTGNWFIAAAIGVNGSYEASKTGYFKAETQMVGSYLTLKPVGEALTAHSELISQLLKEGWELTPNPSPYWFTRHFRRRVKRS